MSDGENSGGSLEAPQKNWRATTAVFLASQNLSIFGSSLVNYAIVWYITLRTSSGSMMTIALLTSCLPQLLISLFAGVWADRYRRKYVIIFSDMLTAVATLVLGLVFLAGYRELWLIFAVSAVRSVGAGIQSPAVSAVLPQFVPKDKLMRVNGVNSSIRSAIMLLSPAAGGWLLAVYSLEAAFFVDVATAAAAVVILLFIRLPAHAKAAEARQSSAFDDLKCGLVYVKNHRLISKLLVYYAFFFFLISPAAFLTPLLIARSYGEEVWRLTANEVLYSAGAVFGGVLMSLWGGYKNRLQTIALACAAYGVSGVFLGAVNHFWIYLAIMFLTGIFSPVFNAAETVLIQENVDNNMQGRIFSIIDLIILAVMPAGMLLFGPVADRVSVESIMIVTGVLMVAVGFAIAAGTKKGTQAAAPSC